MITVLKAKLGRIRDDDVVRKLFGPAVVSVIAKGLSAILSYFMLVVFARLLPAEEYGYFGVAMNAAIVGSVVIGLGLPVAVMRFWPAFLEAKAIGAAKGFVRSSLRLMAWSSAAMLLVTLPFAYSGQFSGWLGNPWTAPLIAVFAAVLALSEFLSGFLRALGQTAWALLPRDVVWRFLAPLFTFGAMTITGLYVSWFAVFCCVVLLSILTLAQFLRSRRAMSGFEHNTANTTDWPNWRKTLIPIGAASLLFAMVQQVDVIVVGGLIGPNEAGAYFAAQKTASLLGLVMIAGGMVAAPLMSAAYHGGRIGELQRLCKLLAGAIAVTTLLGFAGLAFFGEQLLAIFNPTYRQAYWILMILALGFAIDSLAGTTATLMQMTRLETSYVKVMAASYAIVLALQLVFVPIYGMIAAAAATALGYLIWNIAAIYLLRRHIGVDSSILSFFVAPNPKTHA